MPVVHTFVTTNTDAQDATYVGKDEWNAEHVIPSARAKRTSGNVTLNSTSWANIDTGLDLSVAAAAGDILQIQFNGLLGNQATAVGIDVVTLVSGSPVNSVSGSGSLDYGFAYADLSIQVFLAPMIQYAVVSGDISSGTVTLRLRYKTSSGTNRTLFAGTGGNPQLNWCVVNLG